MGKKKKPTNTKVNGEPRVDGNNVTLHTRTYQEKEMMNFYIKTYVAADILDDDVLGVLVDEQKDLGFLSAQRLTC